MSIHQLAVTLTAHAWNGPKDRVAVCPNNNEVHIYKKNGNSFTREHVLKEHDAVVTGISWAPRTNRLVTCSQDRNAYVWTFQQNRWQPTLVILRINRAATMVKWSPNEDKFAVASGAKCVSICYFEEDNDWWVSKHIRKHKSTVTAVAWHPGNIFLGTGSTDFKARIFSAFVNGVDEDPGQTAFGSGSEIDFGECVAEFNAAGWVHDVAWSPSGNALAFVSHDSSLTVIDNGQPQRIPINDLPFRKLEFLNETTIVAAGHGNNPWIFQNNGGRWAFAKKVDEAKKKTAASQSATRGAFSKFQNMVDRGQASSETKLSTKHQNCIADLAICGGSPGNATAFSSLGIDGKIIIWNA